MRDDVDDGTCITSKVLDPVWDALVPKDRRRTCFPELYFDASSDDDSA